MFVLFCISVCSMLMTSLKRKKPTSPPTHNSECPTSKQDAVHADLLQAALASLYLLLSPPPLLCRLSETISATNRMTRAHKRVADSYIAVAGGIVDLSLGSSDPNAQ